MRNLMKISLAMLVSLGALVIPLAQHLHAHTSPSPTPSLSEEVRDLADKLSEDDPDLTLHAASKLLELPQSEALAVLRNALAEEGNVARTKIMKAFELQLDPRANDLIAVALSDPAEQVRQAAISALSVQAVETLLPPLSDILLSKENSDVSKAAAARVLSSKRHKESISLLIKAMEQNSGKARTACAAALAQLTSFEFGENVQNWTDWYAAIADLTREQLLEAILKHREEQLTQVREGLKEVQEEAATAFIALLQNQIDRAAAPPLAELAKALHSNYPRLRKFAAAELGKINSEDTAKILVDAVNDQNPTVREEALNSLGRIGEKAKSAVEAISQRLLEDTHSTVRAAAAVALEATKDKSASPALIDALYQDNVPDVRAKAAHALGEIAAPGAADALVWALDQDVDPNVRREAAAALGKVGNGKTAQILTEKSNDPDHLVRRAIAQSLGFLKTDESLPALRELAGDIHPLVREAACNSLGSLRNPEATSTLVDHIIDPEEKVAAAARAALEKLLGDDLDAYLRIADQSGEERLMAAIYELVLKHFATAQNHQETLLPIRKRLAQILIKQNNYLKATPLFEALAQLSPDAEILHTLVTCYEASARHVEAAKTRLRLVRLEFAPPQEQWQAIVQDAERLLESGRTDELKKLLEHLSAESPDLGTLETKSRLLELKSQFAPPTPTPKTSPAPVSPTSTPGATLPTPPPS